MLQIRDPLIGRRLTTSLEMMNTSMGVLNSKDPIVQDNNHKRAINLEYTKMLKRLKLFV